MPVGATGEWPALSIDGRKKVAEFTIKEVNDKIPVIAGAISPNVDAYVELSKHAGSIGAAGVMILPRLAYIPASMKSMNSINTSPAKAPCRW